MKKVFLQLILVISFISANAQINGYNITMLLTDSNQVTVYAEPNGSGSVKWLQNSVTVAFPTNSTWGNINKNDYSVVFDGSVFGKQFQPAVVHTDVSKAPSGYSYITFWSSADPDIASAQLNNGQRYKVCTITTKRKIDVPFRVVDFADYGGNALDGVTVIGDNAQQHFVNDGTNKTTFYSSKTESAVPYQTGYTGTWSTSGSTSEYAWLEIVPPSADVEVNLTADKSNLKINDVVKFTVTTLNYGANQALDTKTSFKLPAGFVFQKFETSAGNTTYDASTGIWNIGTLNNENSVSMVITAKVIKVGSVDIAGSAESIIFDPILSNNKNTINIVTTNDNPVTEPNTITTTLNKPITNSVTATDPNGDVLTYSVTTPPAHGTVNINPETGAYIYTPEKDYTGNDSFIVTVTDGNGGVATSTVNVTVIASPTLTKYASAPQYRNDGKYEINYVLVLNNKAKTTASNVQVIENLDAVFVGTGCSYTINSITASGNLNVNNTFNGSSVIKTLVDNQTMNAGAKDSIMLSLIVDTKGQSVVISVQNKADFSYSLAGNTYTDSSNSTQTDIPVVSLFMPDGFTPNGDGINDTFSIAHPDNIKLEIQIFNRWGNVVYESKDYQNDWDGKGSGSFLGKQLPNGTYYCTYKAVNKATGSIDGKGTKYLILQND